MPPRPLVIGHRGDAAHAPENTLCAFRAAMAAGADGVETDVRLSRDGVPFLLHDETVTRTTDATSRGIDPDTFAETLPWADLARLDAGSAFAPEFAGEPLALLADLPDAVGDGLVDLDIKPSTHHSPQEVVDVVAEVLRSPSWSGALAAGRVLATSFDPGIVMAALGSLVPLGVPVGLLTTQLPSTAEIAELPTLGLAALAPEYPTLTSDGAAAARGAGLQVWAWTADDPADVRRLAALGVTAIITNDPGGALGALGVLGGPGVLGVLGTRDRAGGVAETG